MQADEEVYEQLAATEVPPFFALGWFITWFAHSVDDLQQISRLFDLFMAAHPLMPLYVTAIVIKVLIPHNYCYVPTVQDFSARSRGCIALMIRFGGSGRPQVDVSFLSLSILF